jgi:spore germination cell wall hydrolase CwlJ-like protein
MKFYIMAAVMLIVANAAQAQTTNLYTEEEYPQAYCMALNIYYEARGSNLADRAATADVVWNRVKDTRYPNTICEVVKQGKKNADGSMRRNACQFSWYCDGKHDRPQNEDLWIDAQMLAYQMVHEDKYRGITEGATHYHATYVKPRWASTLQLVGRIGAHIFYRWE